MENIYSYLHPIDFIIVIAYLIILIGIGYWVSFIINTHTLTRLSLVCFTHRLIERQTRFIFTKTGFSRSSFPLKTGISGTPSLGGLRLEQVIWFFSHRHLLTWLRRCRAIRQESVCRLTLSPWVLLGMR